MMKTEPLKIFKEGVLRLEAKNVSYSIKFGSSSDEGLKNF